MVKSLLLNGIFATILFSVGIANSYEERTVYTQALLTITYDYKFDNDGTPVSHQEQSYSGKYGEDSPKAKAKGILYYAGDDVKWCEPFKTPPIISKPQWIALIPRGNCTYKQKILMARKYNASAAIIFYDERIQIPVMDDGVTDMVSVMISKESGGQLINLMANQEPKNVDCEILVGTHYVDRRWKVSRTSVLFVLVSFILLMCISLAWLVFYYVQRFRHIYRNDRKEKQLLNAAKKAISKLKTVSYQRTTNKDEEDDSCAVCLENFKDGESLRILPCKHEFHKSCIDPWLLNHRTCPMCKSNILKSLGVDIPENITLSDHNIESSVGMESRRDTPVVISEPPTALEQPPTTLFRTGTVVATAQAWAEQPVNIRYSSSSSNISDTDSERSTVALVSAAQKV